MAQKSKNNNKMNMNMPRPSMLWIYGLIGAFIIGWYLFDGSNEAPLPSDWTTVQEMVEKGDVEKIQVVNRDQAQVFLKKDAGEKYRNDSVDKRFRRLPESGVQLTFTIGSVDSFREDLKAAEEMSGQTVPVIYENKANDWTSNTPKESKYEQTMVSFLARLGYSFDDRYFLVGSVRRDASSKLPTSKNYDWFPSVSGSWKLSSEKFFQNAGLDKVFDLVKFRAGWGRIGNVDLYPNNVATVELLNYQYPIIFGQNLDQLLQGTYLNTIPNYSARWETTEQTSAGLDLTMFKNKLNISVDYYHKVTKDLIDYIPTPEQIGVADPPMGNMGNVLNKGWEFSVNYNGSAAQGKLTYNVWGNFSTNKGYVREYGVRQGAVMHTSPNLNSNPILYSDAGQPWYSFMVYRTAGIFRSQDEINKYIYKNPETGEAKLLMPDAKVGDLIFIDTNNDGVINDDDKTFAGSYTPKNTFSFGGSLNWKGFDFSFFFQGVTGNKVYNGLKQMAMNGRNDYGNLISDVFNSWDFDPQGSKYPRLGLVTGSDTNGNYSKFSDIFLEDGDYLRLKNITLGYTLPKSVSRFVGMENGSLRVYMSVDNVCTITGYSGMNPEVDIAGWDKGTEKFWDTDYFYPLTRTYTLGLQFNF